MCLEVFLYLFLFFLVYVHLYCILNKALFVPEVQTSDCANINEQN